LDAIKASKGSTEKLYINVTKPTTDETVYKDTYAICGVRVESASTDDVLTVYLAKYNSESQKYEEFTDTDGNSRWTIGVSGVFIKNVTLKEGDNKFALAAYRKADADNGTLNADNIQVVKFNIIYKSNLNADVINEKLKEITVSTIVKDI
jgi:hypothetical protein